MKLHEIVTANESHETAVLFEKIAPYKRALYLYYRDLFGCEPVLMVCSLFNAAQYVKIVPSDELFDAVAAYTEDTEEWETIMFNSRLFKDII